MPKNEIAKIGMIVDKSNAYVSTSFDILPPAPYYPIDKSIIDTILFQTRKPKSILQKIKTFLTSSF